MTDVKQSGELFNEIQSRFDSVVYLSQCLKLVGTEEDRIIDQPVNQQLCLHSSLYHSRQSVHQYPATLLPYV